MAKYKVGDKVRVRTNLKDDDTRYYMEDKSEWWYFYTKMKKFLGQVVTISEYDEDDDAYEIEEDDGEDYWADEMFVGLAEETPKTPGTYKIGDRVIASDNIHRYKNQPGTIVRVDLNHPRWNYCVEFDARPVTRLWSDVTSLIEDETPTPEKDDGVLFRVRCVSSGSPSFTPGKVYKITKDGLHDNNSDANGRFWTFWMHSDGPNNFDKLAKWFKGWKTTEVKFELVGDKTPEPIQVNVNINVNINTINYDNACWYCRKGGLVDLYLKGQLGICPHCGRMCNSVE